MITDELLEQLRKLDRVDKLRIIQFLAADLIAEEEGVLATPDISETLNDLLSIPPEQAFAAFQNDLRLPFGGIEAIATILEENLPQEHQEMIKILQKNVKSIRDMLNLALNYLESRKK
jgi:signal transduction histidine kinase